MNRNVVGGAVAHRGLFVSFVALLVATVFATPAFAAKSNSKKSKPKEPRIERDSGESFDTRFSAFYGNKTLDKDTWTPIEKQTGFGFEVEFAKPDWPASAVATYFSSDGTMIETNVDIDDPPDGVVDGDLKTTGEFTEIGLGARKWMEGGETLQLFGEAGVVRISVKLTGKLINTDTPATASESASTIGFWFGGGLSYQVSDTISVGAIARISQGKVTLFDDSVKAGGTLIALTLQYHAE